MNQAFRTLLFICITIPYMNGCKKKDYSIVGKWEMTHVLVQTHFEVDPPGRLRPNSEKSYTQGQGYFVEFRDNETFIGWLTPSASIADDSGTYHISNGKIIQQSTKYGQSERDISISKDEFVYSFTHPFSSETDYYRTTYHKR